MRVLVDVTHPAIALFFRAPIRALREAGHTVKVTSRDKDVALSLLDAAGIEHEPLSRCARTPLGLAAEMVVRDLRLLRVVRRFRPDVMLAGNGVYIAHVGRLTGVPSVSFDFDDDAVVQHRLYFRWASRIYTSTSYRLKLGDAQRFYRGVWVLSQVGPRTFERDPAIRAKLGLPTSKPLVFCRLVQWTSNHDFGQGGIPLESLTPVLEELAAEAHLVITSERPLPDRLAAYRASVPPDLLHQVLASADLYLGESATMAAESAVLGVPAIYTASRRPGYIDELDERYGLIESVRDAASCRAAALRALRDPARAAESRRKRDRYLADSDDLIDVILGAVAEAAGGPPIEERRAQGAAR